MHREMGEPMGIEIPVTESELVDVLTNFNEYVKGKGATEFINSTLMLTATNAVVLKAKQSCEIADLLQLVAWGVYLAEKGETRLTPVQH
jgi:hypothetical protein